MRNSSHSRQSLQLSASTPSLPASVKPSAFNGGMQRAYQKFQFYERDQLNVRKYFGGMKQLKKLNTEALLEENAYAPSLDHYQQLSRTFYNSSAKMQKCKNDNHSNARDIPLIEPPFEEVQQSRLERGNQGSTHQHQYLQKTSDQVWAETNFISPRLSQRCNNEIPRNEAQGLSNGKKRLLTLGLNRANHLHTSKNSQSAMFKNPASHYSVHKKKISDWKQAINEYKQRQQHHSQLDEKATRKSDQNTQSQERINNSQIIRSQSTKVSFNPPKKIRDILLDPAEINELRLQQHEELLQKYTKVGSRSTLLMNKQNPQEQEWIYASINPSVTTNLNGYQSNSPFRSKAHYKKRSSELHQSTHQMAQTVEQVYTKEQHQFSQDLLGQNNLNELRYSNDEGSIDFTLPAISQRPNPVAGANYASFQINKSRIAQQRDQISSQSHDQEMTGGLSKIGSQKLMNLQLNDRDILLIDGLNYGQQTQKYVDDFSGLNLNLKHQESIFRLRNGNLSKTGSTYSVEDDLAATLQQTQSQHHILNHSNAAKLSRTDSTQVIGKLQFDELIQNKEGDSVDKKKLLQRIQKQIKLRLSKYKKGAEITGLSLSPSKKQSQSSLKQSMEMNSSKELRRAFNSQAATQEGPYQNQSLKIRHNSLKKILKEKGNSSKLGAASKNFYMGGSNTNLNAKGMDEKEFTQAIDEMINLSKSLMVKQDSPKKSNKGSQNNLSKIMEENRKSPKRQHSMAVGSQSSQTLQLNMISDFQKDNLSLPKKEYLESNNEIRGNNNLNGEINSSNLGLSKENLTLQQQSQEFIKTLTQNFDKQLNDQEYEMLFQIFTKTPQERSTQEEERVIDYLFTISIFKDFPKNLVKEISRKFFTLVLKTNEIIKYKSDDSYQVLLSGKIIKLDPRENFRQSKVVAHSIFDPAELLTHSSVLMVNRTAKLIAISKKEFAKSIKIASLRQGKEDDSQFLGKCHFFNKLEKETLNKVCSMMVPRLIEEGKKVYDIGDVSEEMFIVRSGHLMEQVIVQNQQPSINNNASGLSSSLHYSMSDPMQIHLFQGGAGLNSPVPNNGLEYGVGQEDKLFQFATYKTGDWFGQSEMMLGANRKSRVVATQSTLLLCIRKYELEQAMSEEYFELLRMHIFDHEDLQGRMIQVSTSTAQQQGTLKKYKIFKERD